MGQSTRHGRTATILLLLLALVLLAFPHPVLADPDVPGGTFFDDDGSPHEGYIEAIAARRITKGCNPPANDFYCPDKPLTRGQMAALIVRALDLPPGSGNRFVDDDNSIFEADILALARAGITKGCNPPANTRFCPDDTVTRGQVAAFLTRAYGYPRTGGDRFVDDDDSVFEADIQALARAGITKGCNPPANTRFCPDRLLIRAEIAAFLGRAERLTPTPPPPAFTGRMVISLEDKLIGWFGGLATMDGTRVPRTLLDERVGMPALSPDGSRVAYIDNRRRCPRVDTISICFARLFTIPWGGGAERRLLPNDTLVGYPDWAPDGNRLLVGKDGNFGDFLHLSILDIGTGQLELIYYYQIVRGSWSVTDLIAAEVLGSEDWHVIRILDLDGRQIGPTLVGWDPVWSPDGRTLAFSGVDGLTLVDADGTNPRVIGNGRPHAWSPDGSLIAFTFSEVGGTTLMAQPVDGGEPWALTPSGYDVVDASWVDSP